MRNVMPERFADFMGSKRRFGALLETSEGGRARELADANNQPVMLPAYAAADMALHGGAGGPGAFVAAGAANYARGRSHALYAGALTLVERALSGAGSLGRYTEPLARIAQRGTPALTAAVFTLMQNDPDFHAQITQAQEHALDEEEGPNEAASTFYDEQE